MPESDPGDEAEISDFRKKSERVRCLPHPTAPSRGRDEIRGVKNSPKSGGKQAAPRVPGKIKHGAEKSRKLGIFNKYIFKISLPAVSSEVGEKKKKIRP